MLDKILEIAGSDVLQSITAKTGISEPQAKAMLPLAKESLTEGLLSEMTNGNKDGLLNLFNSVGGDGLLSNSLFNNLKGIFMQKIISGLGLPDSVAQLAAGAGMSTLVGSLAGMMKADGENEGINFSNIVNVLGGSGGAGVLGNMLGGMSKSSEGGLGGLMGMAGDMLDGDTNKNNEGGNLLGGLSKAAGGFFNK